MTMGIINTKFAPKNLDLEDNKLLTMAKEKDKAKRRKINEAKFRDSFGGKRFLGLTPAGKKVMASYTIRQDGTLDIKFTHKLSVLLQPGAQLAGRRYSFANHASIGLSDKELVRKTKVKSGEVTKQTLYYLQRLQTLNEMEYVNSYYKGKVTSFFFSMVAQAIYTGGESGDVTYRHIQKAWKFPEHNPYFVPEQTFTYPDEL